MSFALNLLYKVYSYRVVRGVGFDNNLSFRVEYSQYQCRYTCFFKLLKGSLLVCSLFEPSVLSCKLYKQQREFRVVLNEFLVVVSESKERLYVFNRFRYQLFYNRLNLFRVYMNTVSTNDKSQEVYFLSKELVLLQYSLESYVAKSFEYFANVLSILLSCTSSEDKNVVYIGDSCNVEYVS